MQFKIKSCALKCVEKFTHVMFPIVFAIYFFVPHSCHRCVVVVLDLYWRFVINLALDKAVTIKNALTTQKDSSIIKADAI